MPDIERQRPIRTIDSPFPTIRHGLFEAALYRTDTKQHLALIKGEVRGKQHVPVRIESSCVTGTALHSAGCDCAQQLNMAFDLVATNGTGVILYMDEEGRNLGLENKLRMYRKQYLEGIDTFEAARSLGLPEDARDYQDAAEILKDLGIESIELITNSPDKVAGLLKAGINVRGRVSAQVPATDANRDYLLAKQRVMGHIFDKSL